MSFVVILFFGNLVEIYSLFKFVPVKMGKTTVANKNNMNKFVAPNKRL
jgi:hypothetical protein